MSNDLISREALLTELRNYPYVVDFNKVLEIIHNAPTVDKGYQEGHIDGVLQAEKLYARPIGEWIEENGLYICSECGQIIGENKKNYCATCGADMRKEAENE